MTQSGRPAESMSTLLGKLPQPLELTNHIRYMWDGRYVWRVYEMTEMCHIVTLGKYGNMVPVVQGENGIVIPQMEVHLKVLLNSTLKLYRCDWTYAMLKLLASQVAR
jgi:hypothetical protein